MSVETQIAFKQVRLSGDFAEITDRQIDIGLLKVVPTTHLENIATDQVLIANGKISSIIINPAGAGYAADSSGAMTIDAPTGAGGVQAVGTWYSNAGGSISSVKITNEGSGYLVIPACSDSVVANTPATYAARMDIGAAKVKSQHMSGVFGAIKGLGPQAQLLDFSGSNLTCDGFGATVSGNPTVSLAAWLSAAPTDGDAVPFDYVDKIFASTGWAEQVEYASHAATFTEADLVQDADGLIAAVIGDFFIDSASKVKLDQRVLFKDFTANPQFNGVYYCATEGSVSVKAKFKRAVDAGGSSTLTAAEAIEVIIGQAVFVQKGDWNYNSLWLCTTDSITTLHAAGAQNAIAFAQKSSIAPYTMGPGLYAETATVLSLKDDDVRSTKLKASLMSHTLLNTQATDASGNYAINKAQVYDAGMVDTAIAELYLNGVLLEQATSAVNVWGGSGSPDGDYFLAAGTNPATDTMVTIAEEITIEDDELSIYWINA